MCAAHIKSAGKRPAECAKCRKPITDLIVQAMDKTWHQDHFVCTNCQRPINAQKFNIYNKMPYCEQCYQNTFLKKCSKCGEPIRDVVLTALNKPWHREHFTCNACNTMLSQDGFYEQDGFPYCKNCYEKSFCPLCKECGKAITDTAVSTMGAKFHPECFRCSRCQQPIKDTTFKNVQGQVVCSRCPK